MTERCNNSGTISVNLPWVKSDQLDYSPGATVTLMGGGWVRDTDVELEIANTSHAEKNYHNMAVVQVAADGSIYFQFNLPSFEISNYGVTATGLTTGYTAITTFTDSSGSYTLRWSAADPAVNRAPYFPTYPKVPPSMVTWPLSGRQNDPLTNAVAYGPSFTPGNFDAVSSLSPSTMALGQIVPFELEIKVTGSTAPENGIITVSPFWLTKTTSGANFGFDPTYGAIAAFVDYGDVGTVDPLGNAKVDTFSWNIANPGTNNEQIVGNITVSGLDSGDNIIVEIWVVLKSLIPSGVTGNVQTGLAEANTGPILGDGSKINLGNQTVPLLQVGTFFTNAADISITKSDSPDPIIATNILTYTLTATNNSTSVVANDVVVSDTIGSGMTYIPGSVTVVGSSGPVVSTFSSGVLTVPLGALSPGQVVTITFQVQVLNVLPMTGVANAQNRINTATITAINPDPNTSNNTAVAYTGVIPAVTALSLAKIAGPSTYNQVGQTITYTYIITNTGNVTISGPFYIMDTKAIVAVTQPPANILTPGQSTTATATYTISQTDLDIGQVTNLAVANNGIVFSNQATSTVTSVQQPKLTLTKIAGPSTYNQVGQTITYTYIITNTGNITINGPFSITDTKATVTVTPPPNNTLLPGESTTATAAYIITQTDLNIGYVTNIAEANNGVIFSNQATATVTSTEQPQLTLGKIGGPSTYTQVGQTITYTYTITNTGNVTINGPFQVKDNKANVTVTQPPNGSLSPGESTTATATYTITQADLDIAHVTNIATADNGTIFSNEATLAVTSTQQPKLTLVKTAGPSTYSQLGDIITYTYTIINTGNVTINGSFYVTDNNAIVTVTVPPSNILMPGQSTNATATYTVTQADMNIGLITNIATASNGTVFSNQATSTVTLTQQPHLTLTKVAGPSTYNQVGEVITYSYTITNTGNVTINGPFHVIDSKIMVSVTQPPNNNLTPGESTTATATYTITQADLDTDHVTNIATADNGTIFSNEATKAVTSTQQPKLTLIKTAGPATYSQVLDVITYTYTIINTGNVTINGPFHVMDSKAIVTVTPPPNNNLTPGESTTATATYTITQLDLDIGHVTNVATANNGTIFSNEATATVTHSQQPSVALTLTKVAGPSTYNQVGQVITYSYTITNTGNVTINGPFHVTDSKAIVTVTQPPNNNLTPGESTTATATYTVTQADLDIDHITNTAIAGNGTIFSNEANATVISTQQPQLTLTKMGGPSTYNQVGEVITYSYTITNTGNVTITGPFHVVDNNTTVIVTQPAGNTLTPGQSTTGTSIYTITQLDLDAGNVTNVAIANNGNIFSNEATKTVTSSQHPKLTLTKVAGPSTYNQVGQVITYSYTITNTGNVTINGPFNVTDSNAIVMVTQPPNNNLIPGESTIAIATYTVTQADLDIGHVTNAATADNGAIFSKEATATVTSSQQPQLTLTKIGGPSTYNQVGQVITYTYTLTNTGNVTITGLFHVLDNKTTVTVTQPSDNTLIPGQSITGTATYTITQLDLDTGHVTNAATANNGTLFSNEAASTVTSAQQPKLTLTKISGPSTYDQVGQVITCTYEITNTGNVTISGPFNITDNKTTVTVTQPTNNILTPGQSTTAMATYTITQTDLDMGHVTNTATANNNSIFSNEAASTVTSTQQPKLTLTKATGPSIYNQVGDVITYTFTITNTGNVTISGPFQVTDNKTTVTVTQPINNNLAPGQSTTATAIYTITQLDMDFGYVTNAATANNGALFSNEAHATVTAFQQLELMLVKTASPSIYNQVGQAITYTYTITNTGNVTMNGPFHIADNKAAVTVAQPPNGALSPGESTTGTAIYIVSQLDLDTGYITNAAAATGGTTSSNVVTFTVNAVQNPALCLVKNTLDMSKTPCKSPCNDKTFPINVKMPACILLSIGRSTSKCSASLIGKGKSHENCMLDTDEATNNDSTTIIAGTPIKWTYTVTNTGNVTLAAINVTDNVIGSIGIINTLAPGESVTLEHTGTAVCGPYQNLGTASGKSPTGANITSSDWSCYIGKASFSVIRTVENKIPSSPEIRLQIRQGAAPINGAFGLPAIETANNLSVNSGFLQFNTPLLPGIYQLCQQVPNGYIPDYILGIYGEDWFKPGYAPNAGGKEAVVWVAVNFTVNTDGTMNLQIKNQTRSSVKRIKINNEIGQIPLTVGYWRNHSSYKRSNSNHTSKMLYKAAQANKTIIMGLMTLSGEITPNNDRTSEIYAYNLLNECTINGKKKMSSDPCFNLAAQLLAYYLNQVQGALVSTVASSAANYSQAMLVAANFDGTTQDTKLSDKAIANLNYLTMVLDAYNNSTLTLNALHIPYPGVYK